MRDYSAGTEVESLWVKLMLGKNDVPVLNVGVIYRPPNEDMEYDEGISHQLKRVAIGGEMVVMGDFNFPGIDLISHSSIGQGETFLSR